MGLSLKKNFGFALIGNLGYAASQYIVLLIFIKLYSMEDVGQFIYAGAFATPLMMALEMQLRNFYVTDSEEKLSFRDYMTFRTMSSMLGALVLVVAAWLLNPEYSIVIIIVVLIKTFESQLDLIYAIYQKQNKLDFVAYSRLIRGVVAVGVVALFSFIFQEIVISLIAYLLSWALLYFFYERRQVVRRGYITEENLKLKLLNRQTLKYFLGLCFPVFCAIYVDKFYLNYPRLSVERILGVEALAIFGSLLYFKTLGNQFISSIAQSAMPRLAEYIKQNKREPFVDLVLKMVMSGFFIGAILLSVAWLFGEELLTFLYTTEYADYNDVLLIILLGTMITFGYTFITSALTAIRKQWIRLPVSLFMLGVMMSFFYFKDINSLLDVAYIVLYSELISLLIFYVLFVLLINRVFKRLDL